MDGKTDEREGRNVERLSRVIVRDGLKDLGQGGRG